MAPFLHPAASRRLTIWWRGLAGERNLVRGAASEGIVQGISINASCSLEEMVEVRRPGQPLIFQIYLNKDRPASARLLKQVEEMGFNAIMFTVGASRTRVQAVDVGLTRVPPDSAVPGKRELDIRAKPIVKAEVRPPVLCLPLSMSCR